MGEPMNDARPEIDADAWTPYGGDRDGERVIFLLFDEAANARLRKGDQSVEPELYVTMSPAAARQWAQTLLIASIKVEAPEDLPEEINAKIRGLLSVATDVADFRQMED